MSFGQGSKRPATGSRASAPSRRAITHGAIALGASLALLLVLPLVSLGSGSPSLAGAVGSVLKVVPKVTGTVQSTVHKIVQPVAPAPAPAAAPAPVSGGSASPSAAAPRAGSGSPNTPAMYGINPHGQGTVASVQLTPSTNVPYTYSPGGNPGEIAIGRGRSEQTSSGAYHAHTSIVDLLGTEVLGIDATPGQSNTGPLNAVQKSILNALCTGTGTMVCLSVLAADTSATSTGASTHFEVAHATVGGTHGVDVGAAGSDSSIGSSGGCQTSGGSSEIANVNLSGRPLATVGTSSSSSSACSGQTPTQNAGSTVVGLAGTGVPLPTPGCANGTPNTVLNVLGLASTICNAYDTTEAAAPSGVREALTAVVLPAVGTSLAKTVVAGSESHTVAPASTCTGGSCGGGGGGGNGGGGGAVSGKNGHHGCTEASEDCNSGSTVTCTTEAGERDCVSAGAGTGEVSGESNENGAGANGEAVEASASGASNGSLPFTGEDILMVLLVGLLLAGSGLALNLRARQTTA